MSTLIDKRIFEGGIELQEPIFKMNQNKVLPQNNSEAASDQFSRGDDDDEDGEGLESNNLSKKKELEN